jgi:hypothetical protein
MRAIGRLVWTCFTATPLMRWFAGLGSVLLLLGIAGYAVMPAWTLGNGTRPEAVWLQAFVLILPAGGLLLLLAATTLLPAIIERIALGRAIWLLPAGRVRLLASTLIPPLLLAALVAAVATIAFIHYPIAISYSRVFFRTSLMAFIDFGLIYAAIWLVGKTSGVWRLAGTLWVVLSLSIPLRYIGGVPPFSPLEAVGLVTWVVFALLLVAGGRLRHALASWRARALSVYRTLAPVQPYARGSEIDLLLGTTRPWIVALGQVLPMGIMVWLIPADEAWVIVWFVFLILFSAISGAFTSQAAERSRRLWLRFDWTRDEIERKVELAYWRYNAWSLLVLVLIFLGMAVWHDLGFDVVATSVALLALGTISCTYLGLTITRGLRWLESALCIATLVPLTIAALSIARGRLDVAIGLELLLVALAVAYRLLARSRWNRLDWMLCRPA